MNITKLQILKPQPSGLQIRKSGTKTYQRKTATKTRSFGFVIRMLMGNRIFNPYLISNNQNIINQST
jgi:hypothetical protein